MFAIMRFCYVEVLFFYTLLLLGLGIAFLILKTFIV